MKDKGGACDIGEEPTESEELNQTVTDKIAVCQEVRKVFQTACDILCAKLYGERFLEFHRLREEEKPDDCEQYKDTAPARKAQHLSADDRGENRCETVDRHEDGKEFRQIGSIAEVAGNRARDDDAAGTGETLDEAHDEKEIDVLHEDAGEAGESKCRHAKEQRNSPAEAVAQGTDEELSERHAEHRRCQRHLDERCRRLKSRFELRKCGQIHIGGKGRHRT